MRQKICSLAPNLAQVSFIGQKRFTGDMHPHPPTVQRIGHAPCSRPVTATSRITASARR